MGGGVGPLPFRLSDFLSGAYYAVSITVVLIGLIVYVVTMRNEINGLIEREREHPTKGELAAVAIKVEDRLNGVEKHINDLDQYGTRALGDRTSQLEHENRSQNERIQEIIRRMNDLQVSLNKLSNDIPVIIDRQNVNTNAVQELQRRVWGGQGATIPGGGVERGPTAPH